VPRAERMKVRLDTVEGREFVRGVMRAKKVVASWPPWKRVAGAKLSEY